MKKTLLCILALFCAFQLFTFAETIEVVQKDLLPDATTTALSVNDFNTESEYPYETVGYFLDDVAFISEDVAEVSITFTGNYGSNEYFFSNCYIPIYDFETGKLLDIFYSEVELKKPFATSSRITIKRQIQLNQANTDIYKIKVIMLESLTSLKPNCPVPYLANELVVAKNNITKPTVTEPPVPTNMPQPTTEPTPTVAPTPTEKPYPSAVISAVLSDVSISKNSTQFSLTYSWTDVKLSDKAIALGYNESTVTLQEVIDRNNVDIKHYVGLVCDFEVDLSDKTAWKLVSVAPCDDKNIQVTVDPALMADVSYSDGFVEYYQSNSDIQTTKLKVSDTGLTTYKNLAKDSYSNAVCVGGNAGDVAYRFVDTDTDGTFDTLFVDKEAAFIVGMVNAATNKIYRSSSANALYWGGSVPASITLDPDNSSIDWSISDSNGIPLTLDEIEAGSVMAIKTTAIGSDVYYDITVCNDVVQGVVSECYQEASKNGYYGYGYTLNKFIVDNISYMMADNSIVFIPGDEIIAKVYRGKVLQYQAASPYHLGMIIATNVDTYFGNIYQLQILNQDGEIVTVNLAEKVNGVTYAGTLAIDFPKGDLIAYELNAQGELKKYDSESYNYYGGNVLYYTDRFSSGVMQYKASSGKLGSYYITDDTAIFVSEVGKAPYSTPRPSAAPVPEINCDNVEKVSKDIFQEDTIYDAHIIYNENKEAIAVAVFNWSVPVDMNSYPLVVDKMSTVYVDGSVRTKIYGYLNGEEVAYIVSDNADSTTQSMTIGDIVMIATNTKGEIVKGITIADKDYSGNYAVLDNALDGTADDSKQQNVAYMVTLNSRDYGNVYNAATAQSVASALMTKSLNGYYLKGFGAAGKVYNIRGNLLQLLNVDDYDCTFDGSYMRNYDSGYIVDGYIKDYYINSDTIAYRYNAKTGQIATTSVFEVESDVNTYDSQNGAQLENDDLIYAYNYNGDTKLILIVDVKGDN